MAFCFLKTGTNGVDRDCLDLAHSLLYILFDGRDVVRMCLKGRPCIDFQDAFRRRLSLHVEEAEMREWVWLQTSRELGVSGVTNAE